MAWVSITEDDVRSRLSGAELSALRATGQTGGDADPIAAIIAAVVEEIRGYISASGAALGPPLTLPVALVSAALDRIVWEIMKRPGATILDANDARKEANAAAIRLFQDVAAGRFAVETPGGGATSQPPAAWGSEERIGL